MTQAIQDGWTIEGKFPGQGWDPSFSYRFRPALHAEVTEYRQSVKDALAKVVTKKQVEFLKAHLTSWDRTDRANGAALSITDDAAWETLSDSAMSYLWSDVAGYGPDTWKDAAKN